MLLLTTVNNQEWGRYGKISNWGLQCLVVNTVGRGLRFSRNDRTVEVIKLFSYNMANKTVLKIEKNLNSRGSRYFTSGNARAHLFIHLSKPTEFNEETLILSRKYIYFGIGKKDQYGRKKYFSTVVLLYYDERNFIDILKNELLQKSASNLLKLAQKPRGRVGKRTYNLNGIRTTLRRRFRWKLFAFSKFPGL